jgi:hypothetical protein
MLVQAGETSARRAVHLKPAPAIGPCRMLHGVRLIPLADLVRMKLASFRSKDETHLKDLDDAGLITPGDRGRPVGGSARRARTDASARVADGHRP